MAAGGLRPFVAIYSTFLQRAYDQIIHDAALQKLPVVFCIDRAGLVGEDGPTHHGAFDLSYLSAVPNMTIMAPKDGDEFRSLLHLLVERDLDGPCAVRYPRAAIPREMTNQLEPIEWGSWETLREGGDTVLIATGTMVQTALAVADELEKEYPLTVVNARFIKPLDHDMLESCLPYHHIITLEENSLIGGMGQQVGNFLNARGYQGEFEIFAIPDKFIPHGNRSILLDQIGLTPESIARHLRQLLGTRRTFLQRVTFRKAEKNHTRATTGSPSQKKALND